MKTAQTREIFDEQRPRIGARRVLFAILALGCIAAIVAVAVVARNTTDPLAQLRVRGDIVDVVRTGPVREEGTEGKDLRKGDRVRTDGGGSAQIDFFDGSLVRLDTETELLLRNLSDGDDGRRVSLALAAGRIWNRVAEQRSRDRYNVRIGDATVAVRGTTFFIDCRRSPRCYVVGVDGTAEAESAGAKLPVSDGDCVLIEADQEPKRCNERKLKLIDAWVRENLAEDQQLELADVKVAPPTPSASPSATLRPRRAPAPAPQPAPAADPTPIPTKKPTPEPTDEPTEEPTEEPDPTPTRRPSRTPRLSAPPSPT